MNTIQKVKLFLFDHGIGVPLSQQSKSKLTTMALDLIEKESVEVPEYLKLWYNKNRTFDINQVNNDILGEVVSHTHLITLNNLSKTNKKYNAYTQPVFKQKFLKEQHTYLLEEPQSYIGWEKMVKKSNDADFKAQRLINLLAYEEENNPLYDPWIFLMVKSRSIEKFKLLKNFIQEDIDNINNMDSYDLFNLIINVDKNILVYKFVLNGVILSEIIIKFEDLYDVLYRFYYYYPNEHPVDINDIGFDFMDIKSMLYKLEDNLKQQAINRLEFIANYKIY